MTDLLGGGSAAVVKAPEPLFRDRSMEGAVCDYRYDPMSRCDGVYVEGECDQCGRAPLLVTLTRRDALRAADAMSPTQETGQSPAAS